MLNTKIVVFVCNWSYNIVKDIEPVAGANVIRVMCSGRITPSLILKALELGADGVIGVGCQSGSCHYISGNEQAKRNFEKASALLYLLGIGPEKLKFEQISPDAPEKLDEIIGSFILTCKTTSFPA